MSSTGRRSTGRQAKDGNDVRTSTTRTVESHRAPKAVVQALREKSLLEALKLKKEKNMLLEKMIHFTDAAEKRLAKKERKQKKYATSLGSKPGKVANYDRRRRLMKDLKTVKEFARRKLPKVGHFKHLRHLYPDIAEAKENGRRTNRSQTSRTTSSKSTPRTSREPFDRTRQTARSTARSTSRASPRTSRTDGVSTSRSSIAGTTFSTVCVEMVSVTETSLLA